MLKELSLILGLLEPSQQRDAMYLAEAIYYEARGESTLGQLAVAQTILNFII